MSKARDSARGSARRHREEVVKKLLQTLDGRFSTSLGIDLASGDSKEIFKWFLASILFGAKIGEKIAANTYREFARKGVITPKSVLDTGWDGLVEILDSGGYVRYDFKTATQLLEIMGTLQERYAGDLNLLHQEAIDERDLESRLMEFKGIGPVTTNIFLRDLRGVWEKANPLPSDLVVLAARNLGLTPYAGQTLTERAQILFDLQEAFPEPLVFADFESALVRLGKEWCRKERHAHCPMREWCKRDQADQAKEGKRWPLSPRERFSPWGAAPAPPKSFWISSLTTRSRLSLMYAASLPLASIIS